MEVYGRVQHSGKRYGEVVIHIGIDHTVTAVRASEYLCTLQQSNTAAGCHHQEEPLTRDQLPEPVPQEMKELLHLHLSPDKC